MPLSFGSTSSSTSTSTTAAIGTAGTFLISQLADGSYKVGDLTVPPDKATALCSFMLSNGKFTPGVGDPSGLGHLQSGIQGVVTSVYSKDPGQFVDHVGRIIRGGCEVHFLATHRMTSPDSVPRLPGLVAAGKSSVAILDGFPAESFVVRQQVDTAAFATNTRDLEVHERLYTVLHKAADRVYIGYTHLARKVADDADLTYKGIGAALPLNEDLSTTADPLLSYFDDPKARAQHTRKLVEKNTEAVTAKVTQEVLAQVAKESQFKNQLADTISKDSSKNSSK